MASMDIPIDRVPKPLASRAELLARILMHIDAKGNPLSFRKFLRQRCTGPIMGYNIIKTSLHIM